MSAVTQKQQEQDLKIALVVGAILTLAWQAVWRGLMGARR